MNHSIRQRPLNSRSKRFASKAASVFASALLATSLASAQPPTEADYYPIETILAPESASHSRDRNWKPADDGVALEVGGMAVLSDSRVAVAIRKGEVWLLDLNEVESSESLNVRYHRFASGLHEPLGLLQQDDSLITVQRTEMTRLRDLDNDDVADEYETLANGWGVSGHYHEYAYGPKPDGHGNLWMTLNIGMGLKGEQLSRIVPDAPLGFKQAAWRGWGMMLDADGELHPICAGMRSPSGLGANSAGDMFYTDQQGNWVPTNSLHHMRTGAFFHHPESLASMNLHGSTISDVEQIPNGVPYPDAVRSFQALQPPAVWFPYKKAGQSATDVMLDDSGGKFGPFRGQLFVGEFTQAAIHRVFLEKVNGEYQGACFPFRRGFASAVFRLAQSPSGAVFVGLTNRGWSSLGTSPYGLQRLRWSGETPFEIQTMRARPDGFRLTFTTPVDPVTAADVASYQMKRYTYLYHSNYGSDEIDSRDLEIRSAVVSQDGLSVDLEVSGLQEIYVHELNASGVRSVDGNPLLHKKAFYTLNQIPKE